MIKNTIEAPLWPSVDTIPAQYPWLSADETCEVAVLGGGVTAAMCALRFAEAGIDTVLVSASPVGFGGSACSSGMMTLATVSYTHLDVYKRQTILHITMQIRPQVLPLQICRHIIEAAGYTG